MLNRRNWVLRLSVILNVVILLYFGSHFATRNGAVVLIEELQASGRGLASLDQQPQQQPAVVQDAAGAPPEGVIGVAAAVQAPAPAAPETAVPVALPDGAPDPGTSGASADAGTAAKATSTTQKSGSSSPSDAAPTERSLQDVVQCVDKFVESRTAQRGDYWVLYNYIPATQKFHCWESVTYTTHADYTFLDNLSPMLERWRGPVSLAMYAPGTDFAATLDSIRYARDCGSPLVAQLVTFHVFFGARHMPRTIPRAGRAAAGPGAAAANCARPAPWLNVSSSSLYRTQKNLLYPVNVGRNIAREAAATHFLLASDIELYPSPGVIPDFLEMIRRQDRELLRPNPRVFPLPIFELEAGAVLPASKRELVSWNQTTSPNDEGPFLMPLTKKLLSRKQQLRRVLHPQLESQPFAISCAHCRLRWNRLYTS